jgi:predicted regulator of Ras-like GTPase activity (Roadblock/LC7/MglB family)
VPGVDAGEALTELTRLSAEIERAAILDRDGGELAATPGADAERLGRAARELLEAAASIRAGAEVERVEVTTARGAVYAVRAEDRVAVATARQPVVGALVVHDLRTCLARVAEDAPTGRKRRRKADVADG